MRTTRGRNAALAVVLSVLALGLSAETCNTTGTVAPSGTPITITDRLKVVTVAAGAAGSAVAGCQAGEVMLSGGYAVQTPAYDETLDVVPTQDLYFVYDDGPLSWNSWIVSVLNRATGAAADSVLLYAHVECASGLGAHPNIARSSGAMYQDVQAACPGGSLTGGGYEVTGIIAAMDFPTLLYSYGTITPGSAGSRTTPHTPNSASWNVWMTAPRGSATDPARLQVWTYAVCSTLATAQGKAVTVTAPASDTAQPTFGSGTASCPAGQLLTGAGFGVLATATVPVTHFFPGYDAAPPQWAMTFYSLAVGGIEGGTYNHGGSAAIVPICAVTA